MNKYRYIVSFSFPDITKAPRRAQGFPEWKALVIRQKKTDGSPYSLKALFPVSLSLLFICCILMPARAQTVSTLVPNGSGIDEALLRHSNGDLYGSGYANGSFNHFYAGGSLEIVDTLVNPSEMSEMSDGKIAIAESQGQRVSLYDPATGTFEILTRDIPQPAGMVKMPNSDTLLISCVSSHKIYSVAPNGDTSTYLESSFFNAPVSLVWDDSGNLFIANYNNGVIIKRDTDGTVSQFSNIPSSSLGHIIIIGDHIYATAVFDHKIFRVDLADGTHSIFAGSTSGSVNGDLSNATFNTPNGIVASSTNDSLFISEYNTQSIRLISGVLSYTGIDPDLRSMNASVEVFPNPSRGEIFLNLGPAVWAESLELFDLHGAKVPILISEVPSSSGSVSLKSMSPLEPGVYLLRVMTGTGIVNKKILIENP